MYVFITKNASCMCVCVYVCEYEIFVLFLEINYFVTVLSPLSFFIL